LSTALTPTFGTPTSTSDGFNVSITNYDELFTWETATVTSGSVAVNSTSGSTRVLSVTGLAPGASATVTQRTTRSGYFDGTATVSGTATTGSALAPTFGTPTATSDGFTVSITNFDAAFTWGGSATASGAVSINGSGVVTVSGVAALTSSTATITTTRTGYASGSATVSGTSLPITYTITLLAGTNGSGSNQALTKTKSSALTLPNSVTANGYFTRAGYTVTGWSTSNLGSQTHALGGSFTTDAPTNLYPVWSANSLTVTYNSNSGSSINSITTVTGGTIALAPTPPIRAGYTFAGWSATDGGTAITFPHTHGKTENFSLFAKWTANTYVVTFIYNSASGGNSVETATATTGLTPITLPTPTRDGYTFGGWHSDIALNTSIGVGGASYMPDALSLTPSLYAKWSAIGYTVTYATTNSTGGAAPTDSATYNINNRVVIKGNSGSLVRTGYSFAGWTAASDGTGTVLNSGSSFTVQTSNMTFYPKWSANTYSITYNVNGATGSPAATTSSYTTGESAVTLTDQGSMARTGFTWGGWSETPTGGALSGGYTTATNVTLYAVWTIKSITLTYDKGAASSASIASWPDNATGNYNTSITLGTPTSQVTIPGSGNFEFSSWLLVGTSTQH
jgi:uncharacterized repeat protein (TIGR02543 family)